MAIPPPVLGLPLTPVNPLIPFTDGVLPLNFSQPVQPLGEPGPVLASDPSLQPSNPPPVIPLPAPAANIIPQGATPVLLITRLTEALI